MVHVYFLPFTKNGEGPLQAGLKSVGLNTLLGLIETAGLVDALSGGDALTVFAPTDAALKRFIDGLPSAPGMSIVGVILMSYLNVHVFVHRCL